MIAKEVTRKRTQDSFARLGIYIMTDKERAGVKAAALREANEAAWVRTARYLVDQRDGNRVGAIRITNCTATDPANAIIEIEAIQRLNTRAKGDRTIHLIVSFPPGERPTAEQLIDIEDEVCSAIGLADHQRISAVHTDTDHLHVHIAISKVHPLTRRCISPSYSKRKLMAACERLEIKHALTRTNHGEEKGQQQMRGRGADMEIFGGQQTLESWIKEKALPAIKECLRQGKSWHDIHKTLATYNLQIYPHGAGLVVATADRKVTLRASRVARALSKQTLEKRWGAYAAPTAGMAAASSSQPAGASPGAAQSMPAPGQGTGKKQAPHAQTSASGAARPAGAKPGPNAGPTAGNSAAPSGAGAAASGSAHATGAQPQQQGPSAAAAPGTNGATHGSSNQAAGSSSQGGASTSYQRPPTRQSPIGDKLYRQYAADRATSLAARQAGFDALSGTLAAKRAAHKIWVEDNERLIRDARHLSRRGKQAEWAKWELEKEKHLLEIQEWRNKEAAAIRRHHPLPTYSGWLQAEAASGNTEALKFLRERERKQRQATDALRSALDERTARNVVYTALNPQPRGNGQMVYQVRDGGRVVDDSNSVRIETVTPHSIFLFLSLLADRSGGGAIELSGDQAFLAQAVEMAASKKMTLTFADAELERRRVDLLKGAAPTSTPKSPPPPPPSAQQNSFSRLVTRLRRGFP